MNEMYTLNNLPSDKCDWCHIFSLHNIWLLRNVEFDKITHCSWDSFYSSNPHSFSSEENSYAH